MNPPPPKKKERSYMFNSYVLFILFNLPVALTADSAPVSLHRPTTRLSWAGLHGNDTEVRTLPV